MDDRTDLELVNAARAGDKTAFGRLVERHQSAVRRIAFRMVRNEQIAQELAQETVVHAYLSLDGLIHPERFRSWLFGITLNVCRGHLRDRRIDFCSWESMPGGGRVEDFEWPAPGLDPQQMVEARELHDRVLRAVDRLSPKNRSATLLYYFEELSLLEIAGLLGVSIPAVKGRLYKSREQLKAALGAYLKSGEARERKGVMVEVSVADVVHQQVLLEGEEQPITSYVVVLLDEAGKRALPIWVGPFEGQAIAASLREFSMPRPMTFTFMARLLEASRVEVEEVRVEALKDDTFYAVVRLRSGGRVEEVDARSSDAIALALRSGGAIHVAETVMAQAGVDVSAQLAEAPRLGRGLDGLIEKMETRKAVYLKRRAGEIDTAKGIEQQRQEIIVQVFGG